MTDADPEVPRKILQAFGIGVLIVAVLCGLSQVWGREEDEPPRPIDARRPTDGCEPVSRELMQRFAPGVEPTGSSPSPLLRGALTSSCSLFAIDGSAANGNLVVVRLDVYPGGRDSSSAAAGYNSTLSAFNKLIAKAPGGKRGDLLDLGDEAQLFQRSLAPDDPVAPTIGVVSRRSPYVISLYARVADRPDDQAVLHSRELIRSVLSWTEG